MKKSSVLFLLLFLTSFLVTVQAQSVNNPSANSVLGQADFISYTSGLTASKFNGPMGVAIDSATGKVFISDRYNNRILRFSTTDAYINGGAAEAVLGQTDFTTNTAAATPTASSLNNPIGIVIDKAGRLWAADFNNNRILRYDNAAEKASGAAADAVLGQSGFTTKASGVTASAINGPVGIYIDSNDNLWVADFNNNRVLKFANASAKANGASADVVLGQANFSTKTTGITASTMNAPNGVYVDIYGNLWVSDRVNYRFLRFDNASAKAIGANADGVLGQPDFVTKVSNITKNGSGYARFVWGDKNGRIYCMQENHRITVFDNAASKANGADADGIIGQVDYTTSAAPNPPTASSLKDPKGLFVNNANGDIWVTDASNHRVLRYELNPVITIPLTITAPDGGEEWGEGSIQDIAWTGSYDGKVKLEYSTDSGLSWKYIDTAKTIKGNATYSWVVPDISSANCLVKVSDFTDETKADTSNKPFLISNKVIVVIGSSTAAGQGPANIDSAWVWRYRRYVKSVNPNAMVVNLAVGGYSTYECMPTGFVPPAGKAAPHTNANITKALSYNPDAIIVNLPTNDAYWNYTLTETLTNFDTIVTVARRNKIPIWVTTSQGRNLSQAGRDLLIATKDTILSIYKDYAIDFWTGLTGSDGYILSQYNSGDGVHMNSDAHKILSQRVIDAHVLDAVIPSKFSMDTNKLSFGGVVLNKSKKDSITVSNTGEGVLVIDSVGVDNSVFTVTPKNASIAPASSAKFFVSFSPNIDGEKSGHLIFYHNAANKTDSAFISGKGVSKYLFAEDFALPINTKLTEAGWKQSGSDGINPVAISDSSLKFPDYQASGLGNAVKLKTSGQDVFTNFPTVNSGNLFVSFMLNVSSAGTGDYFIALSPENSPEDHFARVYVKAATNGYNLGMSKNNEPYFSYNSVMTFPLNKTIMVIIKYPFRAFDPNDPVPGDINDSTYVYAYTGSAPKNEPAYGAIMSGVYHVPDAADLGVITLRQGTEGAAANLTVSGIRVQTLWDFNTAAEVDTTPVVTIKEARKDLDNNFIPDNLGKTFKVKAVVISPDFTASTTTNNNYYISDGTAGILLYAKPKLSKNLNIGDSLIVKGTIAQYKGVAEFSAADTSIGENGSIQILKKGAKVPDPVEISVKDLNSEKYEGSLVRVKGLSKIASSAAWPALAGSNVSMTVGAGADSTLLFIDLDTDIDGTTEPAWPQDIVGIASQYSSAATPNNGYELMPRTTADFARTSGLSDNMNKIPEVYALDQNYPNPFNPSTKIRFDLRVNASVTLKIYSIIGQEVAVLLNNSQISAGHQTVSFNANNLPSGIYIYKLDVKGIDGSDFSGIKKMMLLK